MENCSKKFYEELDRLYSGNNKDDIEKYLLAQTGRSCPRCGGFSARYLEALNELGGYYRSVSNFPASLSAFEAAEEVILEFLGRDTAEYASVINNMAGTCRLMGEHTKARKLFENALDTCRQTVGRQHCLYAGILNNMALLCQDEGLCGEAVRLIEEALGILKGLGGMKEEIATSYSNLAALYYKLENFEQAQICVEISLQRFSGAEKSSHYGAALNIQGMLYDREGRYDLAAVCYRESMEKVKRQFGKNLEYATVCANLSRACEKSGDQEKAAELLREAKDIYAAVRGEISRGEAAGKKI